MHQYEKTGDRNVKRTMRQACNDHICCLNILRMVALDCLGDGKLMLFLAQDVMSIIFLKVG
jgi:hypothetical protein